VVVHETLGRWMLAERIEPNRLSADVLPQHPLLLERAQKINDLLLLLLAQLVELLNDIIGLASFAVVCSDGVDQIGRSSVMQEEDALSDAPERSGSELVRAGAALRNAVGEAFAHVVD